MKQHPANGRWYTRVTDCEGCVSTEIFRTEAAEWATTEAQMIDFDLAGRDLFDDADD